MVKDVSTMFLHPHAWPKTYLPCSCTTTHGQRRIYHVLAPPTHGQRRIYHVLALPHMVKDVSTMFLHPHAWSKTYLPCSCTPTHGHRRIYHVLAPLRMAKDVSTMFLHPPRMAKDVSTMFLHPPRMTKDVSAW